MSVVGLPRVAIIMLNWNGWEHTVEALDSLLKIDYQNHRIFLVDNGSANSEGERLKEKYGLQITVILNPLNEGFCAGNNLGIERAKKEDFEAFLLINNDVAVESNFLTKLVQGLTDNSKIGIIGPKVVLYYDRSRLDSVGGYVNLWTATAKSYKESYHNVRTDLDFVHGVCLLVRNTVIQQVGTLDEDFFSYWEEADWCLRAKKRGWLMACNPQSTIYHKVGKANKYLSRKYIYYMLRNALLCMRKNGHWFQWPSFMIFFFGKYVVGYFLYLLTKRPKDVWIIGAALRDYFLGRFGSRHYGWQ